jgi:choline kinase
MPLSFLILAAGYGTRLERDIINDSNKFAEFDL